MTAFSYPKALHVRTKDPGPKTNYQAYKAALREEFSRTCVYCRMPDTVSQDGSAGFHIDHYKPQKYFPELASAYTNLFYSCRRCNVAKGAYWPAPSQAAKFFIPNPCSHRMFDHLRYGRDSKVESHSDAGAFTVDYLDLNDGRSLRFRQDLVAAEELVQQQLKQMVAKEQKLLLKVADHPEHIGLLREVQLRLERLRSLEARYNGRDG